MRTYGKIDLIRYHKLAQEHPTLKNIEILKLYDATYREVPEEEKLNNLKKFFCELFEEMKKEKNDL